MSNSNDCEIVIIGGGPAGLTAAYSLAKNGRLCQVFEADNKFGGISRTEEINGWRFDIGGHRFFTKVSRVEAFWHEILSDEDFLQRPRMSRIYYQGKLYDYPLKPLNALSNLGLFEAVRCVFSYGFTRIFPPKDQSNFEGWVAARFGWRLYRIFFKTYTEKVWGMPATEIQSDWAAQRIKNLSLFKAIANAFGFGAKKGEVITTLIDTFQYPKYGPGMMWEECAKKINSLGSSTHLNSRVHKIRRTSQGFAIDVSTSDAKLQLVCENVISTAPLVDLVKMLEPTVPSEILSAASGLRYRDFLTVALVVPEKFSFPDNWIYIHQPDVQVGRVQNFGSWSPFLVQEGLTCLGLEYFVNEGDDLWNSKDEDLVDLGTRELVKLGLISGGTVLEGHVVRQPKAYPVYDATYEDRVSKIRKFLTVEFPGIHSVGRNGMHRYNNQDHSMLSAMVTVDNLMGLSIHDPWEVNVEQEYHEVKNSFQ